MATTATGEVVSGCRMLGPLEIDDFHIEKLDLDTDVFSWYVHVESLLYRKKGRQMTSEFDCAGDCSWRIIFVYERQRIRVCLQRADLDEGPDAIRLNFTVEFTMHTRKVVHNKNCLFLRNSAPRTCFFLHRGHLPNTEGSHDLSDMIIFTCRFLDWKEEELPKMHTDKAQEEDAGSEKDDDDYDQDKVRVEYVDSEEEDYYYHDQDEILEDFKKWNKARSKEKGISALTSDFEQLLSSGYESDVVLKVQDKEFPVHRAVLGARSSVLRATLSHDPEEEKTGVVKIPDCDPESFSNFLSFLYSGNVGELTVDTALQLYATSDKYDVQTLKSICRQHLKYNLTPESVCDVAVLADQHSDDDLASAVQLFFNRHYDSIMKSSEWTEMLKNNLHVSDKMLKAMQEAVSKKKRKKSKNYATTIEIPTVFL